ncbi:MAG: SUMF1/EgtB/PvdO family nonheme iron enzyme [Sandaracinaceae bacterium]|nr:SUMF1/EgtB/PvdO family nonheme iron enzyme [Sandaracinaceae bacterium]
MRVPVALIAGLAATLGACVEPAPARPQAIVVVHADLPVRLADRLLLEVLADDGTGALVACADGCVLERVVGEEDGPGVVAWPVSFGVTGAASPRYVRAVLYPRGRTGPDGPLPEVAIEHVARLVVDGVVEQHVVLGGECAGIPSTRRVDGTTCDAGRVVPIGDAAPGRGPDAPITGTFRASYDRGCAGAPREGAPDEAEVCIRGGTYLMGDDRVIGLGRWWDGAPEHLVTVSPFFLDTHEYTVGRLRRLLERTSGLALPVARGAPGSATEHCNWDPADRALDAHPLNCVTWSLANAICEAEGRRLATEAEWEWAAGNREHEHLQPGGDREPIFRRDLGCAGSSRVPPDPPPDIRCTRPVGSPRACPGLACDEADLAQWVPDRTLDGVLDMAGNASEWVRDAYQLYTDPCWAPGHGPDPFCDPLLADPIHGASARGGDGARDGYYWELAARRRVDSASRAASASRGFRCARDDG